MLKHDRIRKKGVGLFGKEVPAKRSGLSTSSIIANQNVLQQQHVDWKISNALLKKGTRDAYKT